MSKITDEGQARSFALRLLIHYVGDLHQPLHATAKVDSTYPKGDAGGNFFILPELDNAKNLHSVWDSVLYLFTDTPTLPFNSKDWLLFGQEAFKME